MQDIYPIKPIIISNNLPYLIAIVVLILVAIFLHFLDNKPQQSIDNSNFQNSSPTENIEAKLKKLEDNIRVYQENEFYKNLYDIFTDILITRYKITNAKQDDFYSIQNKISDKEILDLGKEIYFWQYVPCNNSNLERRKNLINGVKNMLNT